MQIYTVDRFGGLQLHADPQEVGAAGAIDMLNADLSGERTRVGSRGGLSRLGTGTASYHKIGGYTLAILGLLRNTGSALALDTVALSTGTVTSTGSWGGSTTQACSTMRSSLAINTP